MQKEKKIYLRPITIKDTENIVRWRNTPSVRKNLFSQKELTVEEHIHYMHEMISSKKNYQFIIVHKQDLLSYDIGTVFLKNIDDERKSCEFGIFIGEKSALGKGLSELAIIEILNFAFINLRMEKVYLFVFSDNIPAVKSYLHVGFTITSTHLFMNEDSIYKDVFEMQLTKFDWKNNMING